ncbi:AraC family transcriptional regulator [Polaribacter vadi]|uniref:AraC family transcriptional regulator n=1 Tax=Polaribacter TaxID=52959 RepID=UPI001C09E5AF|nr:MULTISPECIES: GyrI-like domain-containing protein [Polaribacter]MBU3012779.1 AraC family transcriptional regulator [Polaribacter vadi]MDO6742595.1 GyrI-like domain-containing protein [Polaribacter sp. 1_MG-2023]
MNTQHKITNNTVTRICDAIVYVEENLDKKLTLEKVAQKAYFSPFHFHRLFKVVTNETLQNFINRKRIEKAASFLLHQKDKTVTEISELIGYTNLSSFSKSFKKFYGISPTRFKEITPNKFSKISKTESKKGQIKISFEQYICNINNALNWLKMNTKPEIKKTPRLDLAYISHKGKIDAIGSVYNKLVKWATPKGLINEQTRMVTIYHDSPKITEPNNLRMSACIVLNDPIDLDDSVNLRILSPTKCIVSRFEITPFQFQQAWESSFVWMSENGYKKADNDPFEIYYNNAAEHPENKFIVDFCIPIL